MGVWRAGVAVGAIGVCLALTACGGKSDADAKVHGAGGASGQGGLTGGVSGRASGGAESPSTGGSSDRTSGGSAGAPGSGGAAGDVGVGGSEDGGAGGVAAPRLIIFYTRWGTTYPDWWPTIDAAGGMQFTKMLAPLQPFAKHMTLVSGLTNVNDTDSTLRPSQVQPAGVMDAARTLLTAQTVLDSLPAGPSIDAAVDTCGGQEGPPIRLRVGDFEGDEGLFWSADGQALPSESDPHVAAQRWLGTDIDAPDPSAPIDLAYDEIGRAHLRILTQALAARTACVGTLSWGDDVAPARLTFTSFEYPSIHEMSHFTPYAWESFGRAPVGGDFAELQTFYARAFAYLLELLQSTPFEDGSLFDRSVVIWISESGSGSAHTGDYIPVILAGGALKPLGFLKLHPASWTIERTQGDLLTPLAQLWKIEAFGAPHFTTAPLTELLPD